MIASYLVVLFSLAVVLSLVATVMLSGRPEAAFLLSLFALVVFVVTAYNANFVEVYTNFPVNASKTVAQNVVGVPIITRDVGIQWLSVPIRL